MNFAKITDTLLALLWLRGVNMKPSRQREWLIDVSETIPSIAFLALWRSGVDLQVAGWVGAALAAFQLFGFQFLRFRHNPIMLGINIHLLLITPLIVATYWIGLDRIGTILEAHSYRGVLITVFLVGSVLTIVSKRGFIGIDDVLTTDRLKQSGIMLAATGGAIVWGFAQTATALWSVALPLLALFALRRLLVARFHDRNGLVGGIGLVGADSAIVIGGDQTNS